MVKSPMVKSPTTSQQSGQKPHHYDPITIGGSSDMTPSLELQLRMGKVCEFS